MKTRMVMCAGVILLLTLSVAAQENKKAERKPREISTTGKGVAEAQHDLRVAKVDSAADFQHFRKEAEMKIRENQRKLTALQEDKSKPTKTIQENYDTKVEALQLRNNGLKKKIEESDQTKTSNWTLFKHKLNQDMDELACAIRDIGV